MDFNKIRNRVTDAVAGNRDKIDKGLDKAAQAAKGRVKGHDSKIDEGVEKAKKFLDQQDGRKGPDAGP